MSYISVYLKGSSHKVYTHMGESSKFKKSLTFEYRNLKHAVCIQNDKNFKFKASIVLRHTENTSEKLL